jgi:threonine/homoserine/homoserine lactone efflux protein
MNSTNLLTVTVIGLPAVMSPGPDFIIVTRNSLLYHKRVGLCTAVGIALGSIWWVVASLLGISLVISKTVLLFNALKWIGAAYLIYLGTKSLVARKRISATTNEECSRPTMTSWTAFKLGLLTNLLNPKAALFFVSFRFDDVTSTLCAEFDKMPPVMASVQVDDVGGLSVRLSGDHRLDVFPDRSDETCD